MGCVWTLKQNSFAVIEAKHEYIVKQFEILFNLAVMANIMFINIINISGLLKVDLILHLWSLVGIKRTNISSLISAK